MCRHFREDFGLATYVARFHNVYGPLGSWEGGREKAPAAICRKVIEAKLSGGNKIEIWGNGEFLKLLCALDSNRDVGLDPAYHREPESGPGPADIIFINDKYSEKYVDYMADFFGCKITI